MARIRDQYVLDIDVKGAQRSLNSIKGALGAIAGALAVNEVRQFVGTIVDATSTFERFQTVLTTYLGSQQAANRELRRLQQLANSLPQDLTDVTEAFLIFQRYGLDTTNKGLTDFSNIATANGKSLQQLAEAVGDALTGEYERLKEFGIKISQENGQIIARIGDQQVAAARTSKELVTQLQALGNTRFGGAADANANTLSQSLSNLRGAVFETQVAFGEGLKPALKESADEMARLLRANQDLAKSLGAGAGEALRNLGSAAKLLSENIELIRNALLAVIAVRFAGSLTNLVTRFSSAIKATQGFAGMMGTLRKVFVGFVQKIPLLGGVVKSLRMMPGPVGAVVAAVSTLAVAFTAIKDNTVNLGNVTSTYGEIASAVFWKIGQLAQDLGRWIYEGVGNGLKYVSDLLAPFRNLFVSAFTSVTSILKDLVNGWIGLMVGFFKQITVGIADLPGMFLQALTSAFNIIKEFVIRAGGVFGELWDYITSLGEDEIENTFAGLGDLVQREGEKIAATSSIDWKEIMGTDYIGESITAIKEGIGKIVLEYQAGKISATEMADAVTESIEEQVTAVTQGAAQITEAYQSIIDAVKEYKVATEERAKSAEESRELARLTGIRRTLKEIEFAEKGYARAIRQRINEELAKGAITQAEANKQLAELKKYQDAAIASQQAIAEAAYEEQRSWGHGWKMAFEEYVENATDAASQARSVFEKATSGMEDAIINFAKTGKFEFKSFLNSVLEDLLRSQVRQLIGQLFNIGGTGASTGGGFFSGIKQLFGGFFATGGMIPAGRFGIVGEAGPELVTGPANVTPIANTTVAYTINAVDALSFKQMLAQDPGFLYAVTEQGRKTIPGSRR